MPPRQLFFYEAPEDGGGTPAPEPDPEPVGDTGGDAEGAAEAAAWALSQDDWEATVNYLRQTAPVIQQVAQMMQNGAMQPQQQQAPPEPDFDPFDPESVQSYINNQVQQGLEQGIAPYTHLFNTMAESEGERLARSTMERLDQEVGSFDHDAAYMIAAGALADESLNPDQVLTSAARFMHDFEERIRADERTKYQGEIQQLREAPRDRPIGSSSGVEGETVPTGPRRYHEAVERAMARRRPNFPVG